MFIDITVWFGVAVLFFFPPILLCDIVKFIWLIIQSSSGEQGGEGERKDFLEPNSSSEGIKMPWNSGISFKPQQIYKACDGFELKSMMNPYCNDIK